MKNFLTLQNFITLAIAVVGMFFAGLLKKAGEEAWSGVRRNWGLVVEQTFWLAGIALGFWSAQRLKGTTAPASRMELVESFEMLFLAFLLIATAIQISRVLMVRATLKILQRRHSELRRTENPN